MGLWAIKGADGTIERVSSNPKSLKGGTPEFIEGIDGIKMCGGKIVDGVYQEPAETDPNRIRLAELRAKGKNLTDAEVCEMVRRERFGA